MKHRKTTTSKGFVLVVVLCMVTALAGLLFAFNLDCRADLVAADALTSSARALNCARAGLNLAIAALSSSADSPENPAPMMLLAKTQHIALDEGTCSVEVEDQTGKLNINLLKRPDGRLNRPQVDRLLRLIDLLNRGDLDRPPISYSLIPSIIDWIDADEQTTCLQFIARQNLGAESSYYANLPVPYRPRNAPLETIEELLLVKAVTPELFDRLRRYITVWGDGKVNINSAPRLVIESLSENMDAALAQMIVSRRKERPFESLAQLRDIPGMTDALYNVLRKTATVAPADKHYQVVSRGRSGWRTCTIVAMIRKDPDTGNLDVIQYKEL